MWKEGSRCTAVQVFVDNSRAVKTIIQAESIPEYEGYIFEEATSPNYHLFRFSDYDVRVCDPDAERNEGIVWFIQKGHDKPANITPPISYISLKASPSDRVGIKWNAVNKYLELLDKTSAEISAMGINLTTALESDFEVVYEEVGTGVIFDFYSDIESKCYFIGLPPTLLFTGTNKVTLSDFIDFWGLNFFWSNNIRGIYEIGFSDGYSVYFHSDNDMGIPVTARGATDLMEDNYVVLSKN
jgi:hypothetical protein